MPGCGCREGKWFATLYTCNYGPNGNFIRGEMYRAGRGCSACPAGTTCSAHFPALCSSNNTSSPAAPPAAPAFLPQVASATTAVTTARTRVTTTVRPAPLAPYQHAPATKGLVGKQKDPVEKQTAATDGKVLFSCTFQSPTSTCLSK